MYNQYRKVQSIRELSVGQVIVFIEKGHEDESLYHYLGRAHDKDMYFYELELCSEHEDRCRFTGIDFNFGSMYLQSFAIPGPSVIRIRDHMIISGPNDVLIAEICRGSNRG